jgi:serine/threonine protein kinase
MFGKLGDSEKCDFWAVGCILYEMLFGSAPFVSDSYRETKNRILKNQNLIIPSGVSPYCVDFIKKLICDQNIRMGYEQIVNHPWMKQIIDRPGFVPKLRSEIDVQYFD